MRGRTRAGTLPARRIRSGGGFAVVRGPADGAPLDLRQGGERARHVVEVARVAYAHVDRDLAHRAAVRVADAQVVEVCSGAAYRFDQRAHRAVPGLVLDV